MHAGFTDEPKCKLAPQIGSTSRPRGYSLPAYILATDLNSTSVYAALAGDFDLEIRF